MAENSKIEWCDHTFNPWIGCAPVSPACDNCYARRMMTRYPRYRDCWGPEGDRVRTSDTYWKQPLKWNRQAGRDGTHPRVFCGSCCDVFEDRPTLEETRKRLWILIDDTPQLDWLLLTKRPEYIEHIPAGDNVWLGVTVENQEMADERIPELLQIPAAIHFVSCEPLLSHVELTPYLTDLDWVIAGGESGPNARPSRLDWFRSLHDQCTEANTPFFFKQMSKKGPIPEDLLVREMP